MRHNVLKLKNICASDQTRVCTTCVVLNFSHTQRHMYHHQRYITKLHTSNYAQRQGGWLFADMMTLLTRAVSPFGARDLRELHAHICILYRCVASRFRIELAESLASGEGHAPAFWCYMYVWGHIMGSITHECTLLLGYICCTRAWQPTISVPCSLTIATLRDATSFTYDESRRFVSIIIDSQKPKSARYVTFWTHAQSVRNPLIVFFFKIKESIHKKTIILLFRSVNEVNVGKWRKSPLKRQRTHTRFLLRMCVCVLFFVFPYNGCARVLRKKNKKLFPLVLQRHTHTHADGHFAYLSRLILGRA